MKAGGVMPLSSSLEASMNLSRNIKNILQEGGFVHMYPESALWFRYEKSRPYKIGAFKFASDNDVPVVPITILFKKSRYNFLRRKKTVIVKIGKPVYPEKDKTKKENALFLQNECQNIYNKTVQEFYGYSNEDYQEHTNYFKKQS